jgi:hypothetical protein
MRRPISAAQIVVLGGGYVCDWLGVRVGRECVLACVHHIIIVMSSMSWGLAGKR